MAVEIYEKQENAATEATVTFFDKPNGWLQIIRTRPGSSQIEYFVDPMRIFKYMITENGAIGSPLEASDLI